MTGFFHLSIKFLGAALVVLSANYFFNSFGEKKKGIASTLLSVFSLAVIFLSTSFTDGNLVYAAVVFICALAIAQSYEQKLHNKLLLAVLYVVISLVAELVAGLLLMTVFSLGSLSNGSAAYCAEIIFPKILLFGFFFVIRTFNTLIFKIVDGIIDSHENQSKLCVAEEIIKQQTGQYELLLKNNEEILKLKHDYKNFIIGILTELKNENYKTIEKRLAEQASILGEFSGDSISGNSIIDTVLSYKTSIARSKGITVNVTHKSLKSVRISGIDMAIILGNALDNAIEATELLEDDSLKIIEILAFVKNEQIFITVKNPVKTEVNVRELKTTKKNSFSHGFGILNMRSIAQKHGGSVTFDCENNIFSNYIVMKNTDE